MKKFLAFTAAAALCLSLIGCSRGTDNNTNSDVIDSTNYRVGIGSYTTTADSSSSVEGDNGKGVVSTTYATVVFDQNNVIKKVYIDEVQSKIYFDGNGQLVNNSAYSEIKSKRELGDEYGMKAASGIGKEWYEQVNSLESWLVGRNIEEISKGVVNMGGYGTNGDYANNVTEENNMMGNAVDGAENIAGDIVNGAENIAGNLVNGGNNMMENNNDAATTDGANNTTGDTQNSSTPVPEGTVTEGGAVNEGTADNGNMNGTNALDWKEDLKSSVTIDLTNIQIALHKAYMNAK